MIRYQRVRSEDKDVIEVFVRDNLRKFAGQFYYNSLISEKAIAKYKLKEVMEKSRMGVGFFARSKSHLMMLGIITYSKWDSQILGKKVGKLTLYLPSLENETEPFLKRSYLEAKRMNVDVLFTRISMEQSDVLQLILAKGAILGDVLLTFFKNFYNEKPLQEAPWLDKSNLIFEEGKTAHEAELRKITSSAYKHSHYFNDPKIPSEKAEAIYQEWISNSLKGFADHVIIAKHGREIVGYITLRIRNIEEIKVGIIDLIAVKEAHRGQGIGKLLVLKGIEKVFNRVNSLYVGTQISNMSALRLYESLGFKAIFSEATLHIWL